MDTKDGFQTYPLDANAAEREARPSMTMGFRPFEAPAATSAPLPKASHPVLSIIDGVLEELGEPAVGEDWSWREGDAGRVRVNGVAVPVRRLAWTKIGRFFEQVYDHANARLFDRRLPGCRLRWNRRFRNLGGRIDCRERFIELSNAHFEACGAVALGVIVVHEQIHLALYEAGLPNGHTRQFKTLSSRFGMPKIHHELPLPERLRRQSIHLYICVCGRVVESPVRYRKPRACEICCDLFNRGRYDERFRLRYIGSKDSSG